MYFRHFRGVLDRDDCDSLMRRGQHLGFALAPVNHYGEQRPMPSVRNNDRAEFDDAALAAAFERRLRAAAATDFPADFDGRPFVRLGARFRLYRYVPGQFFKPHKDGSYEDVDCESEITALFYLNDTDGGETILMPHGKSQEWSHVEIVPRAGDVLLFEHGLWHEGRPVNAGAKFVARTDLFFSKAPQLADLSTPRASNENLG
jgi:prolyl 4-hydroxylase